MLKYNKIFIFTPLIAQVNQLAERIRDFLPSYNILIVDSDKNGTRNIDQVIKCMNENCIIISTYASAKLIISQLFTKTIDSDSVTDDEEDVEDVDYTYVPKFDLSNSLLIVDEVHNLINDEDLISLVKGFPNTLLMTATPPSRIEEIIDCTILYHYPMYQAIKDGLICDYNIYLPLLENKEDKKMMDMPMELIGVDELLSMKALFLIHGMLQTGSRRCIAYLSSIEECEKFITVLHTVKNKYHAIPLWTKIIVSEVTSTERINILKEFEEDTNDNIDWLKIIASVRILDEAINIKRCDSTFIGHIGDRSSDIRIVQRLCRANRKDTLNPNKKASCFIWSDDLNSCVSALSLLKENDIEFIRKINYINANYDKNDKIETIKLLKENDTKLIDYINVKCLSTDELADYRMNLLFKCFIETNRPPKKRTSLSNWFRFQLTLIKDTNNIRYIKFSANNLVKQYIDNYLNNKNIDIFALRIQELFDYYDKNKCIPPYNTPLGRWYIEQKCKIIKTVEHERYIKLSVHPFFKANLDEYMTNKNIDTQDLNIQKLFKDCDLIQGIPDKKTESGYWYYEKKRKFWKRNNWKETYDKLVKNKYVKADLDEYLENINISRLDKRIDELFKDCNINKCIPKRGTTDNAWLADQRRKIQSTNDELYIKLSKNQYVKKYLDNYFSNKNVDHFKLRLDELIKFLHDNLDNMPNDSTDSIGFWFFALRKKIKSTNDKLYIKLSDAHPVIKKNIDTYLYKKNTDIHGDHMNNFFKECNDNKHIPPYDSFLGRWFQFQKGKIESIDDDLYKKLAVNPYAKISMDKLLQKRVNVKNKKT